MSKIQPGMLCQVIRIAETQTFELVGRIVTAVRRERAYENFVSIDGHTVDVINLDSFGDSSWVISANMLLPWRLGNGEMKLFKERPILESMLKPLIDPDHGVTAEEVRSLYSPSRQFSDDLITLRISYQGNK
jgi:hypothetical protein